MNAQPEWMSYLTAITALVFVAGLIVLSGIILKRTGLDKRLTGGKSTGRLSVVETLYLDPRRRIVIVRSDDSEHVLLLGATGDLLIESRKGGRTDAS